MPRRDFSSFDIMLLHLKLQTSFVFPRPERQKCLQFTNCKLEKYLNNTYMFYSLCLGYDVLSWFALTLSHCYMFVIFLKLLQSLRSFFQRKMCLVLCTYFLRNFLQSLIIIVRFSYYSYCNLLQSVHRNHWNVTILKCL